MSKYIDTERLKAEIRKELDKEGNEDAYGAGYDAACIRILQLITSLQQERPEADLISELKHYLATASKEQLEQDRKDLEHWGDIRPTVQEFLYGKESEVDLDREIDAVWNSRFNLGWDKNSMLTMNHDGFVSIARHFWNKGYNARKEE